MEERWKDLWGNLWFKIVAIGVGLILLLLYGYFFNQQVVAFGDTRLVQHKIEGGYSYTGTDRGQAVHITVLGDDTAATVTFDLPNVLQESYDLTYVDQQLCIMQEDAVLLECTADLSDEYWYFFAMLDDESTGLSAFELIGVSTGSYENTYQYTPSSTVIADYAFAPRVNLRGQPLILILLFLWIPIWVLDARDKTFFFRHRRGAWMSKESEPSDSYYDMRNFNLHRTYPLLCLGTLLAALFLH